MIEQSWIPSPPPLLGTERQLDCAATERHKLLVLAEHALRIGRSLPGLPEATVRDALDWLGSINAAGWWLDHRDLSGIDVALVALGGVAAAWHPTNVD
jgi:hypothetical protein